MDEDEKNPIDHAEKTEHYNRLLKDSPAKRRFHELFQQFPTYTQLLILRKYSGIFNYYHEIGDDQVNAMCDKLEKALFQEELRLYHLYKDFI